MATSSVSITATFGSGKPLSVLSDLIAKRQEFLKGETTENAVTATAINILTGIRARTKKADPKKASQFGVKVFEANDIEAGYKSSRGENRGRRVIRQGDHELGGVKVVNLIGRYVRGESPKVFRVIIKSPKVMDRLRGGYERVYVISRSMGEAKAWAEKRLENYVKIYSGTAKWIIGQAQSQIYQRGMGGDEISQKARALALKNLVVSATGSGFGRGDYSIYVGDNLDYAKLSLQNGPADFDLALKKAANRTAAIINKIGGYALDEKIPTPFPEVKASKK